MADIRVKMPGGKSQVVKGVKTVGDVRKQLSVESNMEATINGEPADNDTELIEGDSVVFAGKVRGGNR